jgi:hypothetical protein
MNTPILSRFGAQIISLLLTLSLQADAQTGGLQFDGVNDYVTFGPAPGLGASNFTIETWFKRTGAGVTASTGTGGLAAVPLVTKGRGEADGSNLDMNWFLGLAGDKLAADFEEYGGGQNYPVTGGLSVTLNVWHHAAVTYDGGTWRLYLDGALDTALTVGKTPRHDSIQHAALGSALTSTGAPAGYFAGLLMEARMWNYARSAAEIAAGMSQVYPAGTTGLLARWALDETSGTTANDDSGHNQTGTLTGGPLWANGAQPAVQIIKGPWLQNVTTHSVVVMWETQVAANSRVEYGAAGPVEWFVEDAAQTTIHELTLPNLAPNTRYFYTVQSGDGQSATNSFWSAPDATVPYRFVAYGDTRSFPADHAAVVRSILPSEPDFALHVGDFVNSGRIYAEWEPQYFTPAAPLLKNVPLFPVLGNHEFGGTERIWYYDFFSVPDNGLSGYGEHFYAFTYGCARFIGLSACEGGCDPFTSGTPQYAWLVGQLTSPEFINAKWRFVWMHNPPYTATARDNAVDQALRAELVPLFEQYGVDVVFSGDDHFYRHSLRNGIHYIITGGGGAPLHDVGTQVAGATLVYGEKAYQHCVIDLDPGVFRFYSVRTNGTVMDSFSLTNDAAAPALSGIAATDVTQNSARIVWTTDEPANSKVDYGLSASYGAWASNGLMTASHSIPLANLQPNTTYHYRVNSTDYAGNTSSSADYTFTTLAGNQPPVAQNQTVTTAEDAPLAITLTATDADGDTLTYGVVTAPAHGTLNGTAPNLTYTPALSFSGPDSFTFKANDGHVDSALATVSITVTPRTDPPVAPLGLTATPGNQQVGLAWQASSGADSYTVYRSEVSGGTYSLIASGLSATTYTDGSLQNGKTYFYVVTAVNAGGESPASTEASATPQGPPSAPGNLVATAASKSQINLSWRDNSNNENGFEVERSTDNITFTQIAILGANVTTYSSTGLLANKQYYHRVRAYNAAGNSAYSNTAKTRTLKR